MRTVLLLAVALAAILGGLTLSAPPVRAIEITNVTFPQCASRSCTIPFTLEITITASGAPPMFGVFVWGDGASSTYVQNNGTSGTFDLTHSYTVKGNYTLNATITDNAGSAWTSYYKVSALMVGYGGAAAATTRIEGYGLIPALQREERDDEIFTAIIQNTGSVYIQPWTLEFFAGSWGQRCDMFTIQQGLVPGAFAYVASTGPNGIFPCGDSLRWGTFATIWARMTSSSWPSLNATSPAMAVSWSASTSPAIGISVHAVTPTVSVGAGSFVNLQYQIINIGQFTLDLYGTPVMTPSNTLLLMPADLGNPSHSLVINETAQQAFIGTTPVYQGAGRLILQPGQEVIINRTVQAIDATVGSVTLKDTIQASCLEPPDASFVDWVRGCGVDVGEAVLGGAATVSVTVTLQITPAGATIQMSAAIPLGNGTEEFQGIIVTMGANTPFLNVRFQFWKRATPAQTYTISAGIVYAPGTVKATAIGLSPGTNYTVQLVAQGTGAAISSNTLDFVTAGVCVGAGCAVNPPSSTPSNFISAFIYQLAGAAGMPPDLLGFLIGIAALGFALLFILVVTGKLDVELPPMFWAGFFPVMLIINVWLFFWPPVTLVLIIVPEAILLAREFMSGGSNPNG